MTSDLMAHGFIKQKKKSLSELTIRDEVFVKMVAMAQGSAR
jgi:hypothetical protein